MRAHKASRIPGLGCRAVARCAIVCCSCSLNPMNPRVSPRVSVRVVSLIIPSMAATQSPDQLSAWFGLSSCSSRVSPRASARGVSLNTPSMTAAHSPHQSNAWVGLSSCCSTCDCVLPLLLHLRVRINPRVNPRASAPVVSLITPRMTAPTGPARRMPGWAVELLLDVL